MSAPFWANLIGYYLLIAACTGALICLFAAWQMGGRG